MPHTSRAGGDIQKARVIFFYLASLQLFRSLNPSSTSYFRNGSFLHVGNPTTPKLVRSSIRDIVIVALSCANKEETNTQTYNQLVTTYSIPVSCPRIQRVFVLVFSAWV